MGTEPPQTLRQFHAERRLWELLGLRREDINNRPLQEVQDYMTIISLIDHVNAANNAQR